jgi:hypothetical protein
MIDWYTLFLPIALLGIVVLFRFAGCGFEATVGPSYSSIVVDDGPLVYYRLQETGGLPAVAADQMNFRNGTYGVSPTPLNEPAHLSPQILTPDIQLGVLPSIVPQEPGTRAVRFNGSDAFTTGHLGILPKFTIEAIVRPEWNLINGRGFFYCVLEHSVHVPGQGAPFPLKNAGFALFAGPHDLANPATSPYCWQFWVGTGTEFHRAVPMESGPVPPVAVENTYLAVAFDDPQVILYVYREGDDIDFISHELHRPPYLPAVHQSQNTSLRIGIAGASAALVPPFPGPTGLLYPFVGRMAEVAIYNTVLGVDRIKEHIMAAFNT